MSQKTNPISLRLQKSNKHFQSCWYSDLFYDQVLSDEIQFRKYIEGLLYQSGRAKTLPSIQSQYKRYCTFLFLLDQRAERHKREFSLKLSRDSIEDVLLPKTKFLPSKNKACIPTWDCLLLLKAQEILRSKNLSQKEKYKSLIEEGREQKSSGLTHKHVQEYIYNYAIKGPFLEQLLLSGLYSTRFLRKGATYFYNSIINPGLKDNINARVTVFNKVSNGFFIDSKGFLGFLVISFALIRSMPCVQEIPFKTRALVFSEEESFGGVKIELPSKSHNVIKGKNTVFFKNSIIKKSTETILSIQERECENLFRRLIIDQYSQSSQSRLSYWSVKRLEKQFKRINILSLLNDKYSKLLSTFTSANPLEKTNSNKNSTCSVLQEWRTKALGLARHTELFLNSYSGNFWYHTVYPIRAISPFQSAGFLLESIAYLLQRKSSFRQIKDDIFRELDQYQIIKGARLSCAGRLGGRSKKAQKAKTQSAQWGETSLTVFSSRLDFASKGVNTTYGKVGVKLWLCYKA